MTWANRISFFRIFCTPVFVGLLLQYRERFHGDPSDESLPLFRWLALGIFLIAILSDGLDGYIARFTNQKTILGTIIDPVADKLLLLSATIILSLPIGLHYKIPSWLAVAIVSRDLLILLGALVIFLIIGKVKFTPHYVGKITTALQMVTILLVLCQNSLCIISFYLTLLFTVLSGLTYLYRETRAINSHNS